MNIGRLRLANQHVSRPTFDDPSAVVRWLGAVQAQDYLGGLWAVGLRTRAATEASVEAAVVRREIVRTWPMRGTLHFVSAADVRWILPLLTPRVIAGAASRYRQLELDAAVFARASRLTEKAMADGKPMRRETLYGVWQAGGIATHESRGLHLLGHLAQSGLLCFGPRDGKQHTLALLEDWLPQTRPLARDEALGELARRYFTSHGPASIHDFAWWSGLTITDARAGVASVASELVKEDVGGRVLWTGTDVAPPSKSKAAHLLPAWDEFTVAYRDRTDILDPRYATKVNAGGGVLKPVIVIDGKVVGTWQRTLGKQGVVVAPTFFGRPDRGVIAVCNATAKRYARFLGAEAAMIA